MRAHPQWEKESSEAIASEVHNECVWSECTKSGVIENFLSLFFQTFTLLQASPAKLALICMASGRRFSSAGRACLSLHFPGALWLGLFCG